MAYTTYIYDQTPDLYTIGGRLSRTCEASELSAAELARRLVIKIAAIKALKCDLSELVTHRVQKFSGLLTTAVILDHSRHRLSIARRRYIDSFGLAATQAIATNTPPDQYPDRPA